ncbi:MAG: MG2 domain-containing protein, partial [Cytophagales bacterium]|nr:MG2 domain-containing protein [Cytophagales bacterium]
MCKYTLIALALFLFHSTLFGQIDDDFYITHWSEVHKNELKELPKSALVIVDSIYAQAREEQNYVQLIKAMIFQAKFATKIVENHELYIVDHFKDQISNSVSPLRNVLESTLAQIYWQYYQNHRWGFYQRSRTENKVNPEDFRTWDLRTLFEEIHYHYQESVNNPEILQHIPLGEIDELLELYEGSKQYRPTLYDFLAHNALNFYQSSESRLTEVSNKFEIRDEQYFKYSNHHEILIPDDSLSLDYQSILMYHELLKFHKSRKDTSAFIMTELDRLEFLKDHGIFSDPDRLYINALQTLKADFRDHPASTLIDYQLANSWFEKGANYNPGYNKEHQYAKRKALEICEVALLRFPESHGAKKCRQLKSRIIHPSLSIIAEGYIPINTHSRLLVRYTNIEELNFYVLKVSETQRRQYQELRTDSSRLALMTLFEEADSWECILPGVDDYQEHTTETILPPLAGGNYMVAARLPKQKEIFGYAFIQVTDLVLVETSMDNQSRFQVLYRKNGSPVKDAVIQLKNNVKQANRKHYDRAYVTDKNGFSTVAKNDEHYGNLQALVTSDSDTARFGNYYLSRTIVKKKDRNNDKPIYAKPFVFMDRSIYRPGQTVYFKGILTKKQADEISVVSGEYVEVYLYDPNDEEISFLRLKTNEFGSFSGEFKLPTSGLTGEYSISAEEDYEEDSKFYDEDIFDFEWNELYFSVEEYKRPRFEVAFDPVKDAFRLMDSVSISGKAAAFTGAYISNAKVTYKVTRTVRYPSWYYWSNPGRWQSSEAREITYGETATDPDGSFNISFMAIPDELVAKEEWPVFEYRITADITDINGETRSAEATIKVGYHTMNITINTPAVINKNNSNDFLTIDAQNLNGQKTDARGSLKLYQVKTPSRVLRDRPWPAPDFQEIPEDKFVKLFPHDPYKGENNSQKQEKGKLVFSTEFDTEKEDSIKLPVDDRWEAGNYIVEIESKDVYDQPVLSKSKFKLKGDNSSSVTN